MHATSSNQASTEAIKNLRPTLTRERWIFSSVYGDSHQVIKNLNVAFTWILQYNYQMVRKLSISANWLTGSLPEVNARNAKLSFLDESTHNYWCFVFNFMLLIILGVTWQNDNKNLPIVSLNFFCELSVSVTCDTSNWSSEGTDLKNTYFTTNWSSDRKLA